MLIGLGHAGIGCVQCEGHRRLLLLLLPWVVEPSLEHRLAPGLGAVRHARPLPPPPSRGREVLGLPTCLPSQEELEAARGRRGGMMSGWTNM